MEVQDVQLILAKQWGITIPGLGPPVNRNKRRDSKSGDTNHKRKAVASSASNPSKTQKTDDQRPGPTI